MSTITVFLEFPLYWDYSFEKVSDDEEDKKNLFFEKLRDIKNKLNTFVTENRHLNLDFSEFQTCYYQLVKILMLVTNDLTDQELNQLYNKYEKLLHNEVKKINLWSFLSITNNQAKSSHANLYQANNKVNSSQAKPSQAKPTQANSNEANSKEPTFKQFVPKDTLRL